MAEAREWLRNQMMAGHRLANRKPQQRMLETSESNAQRRALNLLAFGLRGSSYTPD